jgi:hypothetical protein
MLFWITILALSPVSIVLSQSASLEDQVPEACKNVTDNDNPFDGAVTCAMRNLISCFGLLSLVDGSQTIPGDDAVCADYNDLSCSYLEACPPCEEEFLLLIDCLVLESNVTLAEECDLSACESTQK